MVTEMPVGEARIWTVRTADLSADAFVSALSAEELDNASRMHSPDAGRDYVIAHALARSALSLCQPAIAPAAWTFTTAEHGRPEVAAPTGDNQLRFNIAHSAGVVACIVTRAVTCGIDVEPLPALGDLPTRRVLSADEADLLAATPVAGRPLLYARLWTAKEAYSKARGLGLLLPFDQLAVTLGGTILGPTTGGGTIGGGTTGGGATLGAAPTIRDTSRTAPADDWLLQQWQPTGTHVATAVVAGHVHVVHDDAFPS